uniref:Uncharacterized protein n=1 Tax=Physcomitrium patens TaxID=3218 RepID=A0A7I3ZC24_PHYPA
MWTSHGGCTKQIQLLLVPTAEICSSSSHLVCHFYGQLIVARFRFKNQLDINSILLMVFLTLSCFFCSHFPQLNFKNTIPQTLHSRCGSSR